jgi:CBS domain-containing protein
MSVAAILKGRSSEVIQLGSGATVQEAAELLSSRRIGCLPVIDMGRVVGIISERDIVRVLGTKGASVLQSTVGDVMTSPALTISPDMDVMSALAMMTQRRIRHLPVIDNEVMIGFVSIGDLVKYRIDQIEAEASAMRDYIQSA